MKMIIIALFISVVSLNLYGRNDEERAIEHVKKAMLEISIIKNTINKYKKKATRYQTQMENSLGNSGKAYGLATAALIHIVNTKQIDSTQFYKNTINIKDIGIKPSFKYNMNNGDISSSFNLKYNKSNVNYQSDILIDTSQISLSTKVDWAF